MPEYPDRRIGQTVSLDSEVIQEAIRNEAALERKLYSQHEMAMFQDGNIYKGVIEDIVGSKLKVKFTFGDKTVYCLVPIETQQM